jgi:molecular chaperone DnaK
MSVAIGIDLGTTNTVVAAVVDGIAVTLEDEQGHRLIPSVVSFHPSGTVLVGDAARERRLIDPENTIFSIKPLIGRPFDSDEVRNAKGRFPFQFVEGAKNSTMVLARDVAYALPEISAFVLRRAKAIAEAALGQPVDRAVITVPANFNDLQRASTKIAGKLAGLEVMRILNEPTAAALAYGQSIAKAEKIGVFDLGGGTFDITLLDLTGNVFEVLATAGDTTLGGDDIDKILADRISLEVTRRFNYDPRTNPVAFARLRFMAEDIKKELSTAFQAGREITGIGYTEGGHPISMQFVMTREELERLVLPLVERTISVAKQSIEIIGLHPKDFDRIILVGGSTRMPMVARMVEQLFAQPPHLKVNPDEVVALGAAIQAHALNRSKAAHKRRSAHDQLAPQGQQPPPGPGDVPRAPPVPNLEAPQTPQFFSFQKAPAVITFSSAPGGMPPQQQQPPPHQQPMMQTQQGVPPAPHLSAPHLQQQPPPMRPQMRTNPGVGDTRPGLPPSPGKPPPVPGKKPGAPPPVPKRGQTDHAKPNQERPSVRQIEGTPLRPELSEPPPAPKPPRRSGEPPSAPELAASSRDMPSAPDLDMPAFAPQEPTFHPQGPPSGGLGAVVAAGDFFPALDAQPPQVPALSDQLFQQGSAIETKADAPLLIDVTPLSLRVETVGGYSDVLIPANSAVPCEKTRTFLTASDGQTMVLLRVAQGESAFFRQNTHLGDLELSGLKPARRGEVKILVTFELDADGILNVRAKDKDTGRETKATMKLLGANVDAADVQAMQQRQARHHVA